MNTKLSAPFIYSQRNYDRRIISLILPELKDLTSEDKRNKNWLVLEIQTLITELNKKLDILTQLGKSVYKISAEPGRIIYGKESIESILNSREPTSAFRILVNLGDFETSDNLDLLKERNISHLVEIAFNETLGWHKPKNICNVKIQVNNIKDIINVIEDVILDICISNTYLDQPEHDDINFKQKLSKHKVDYAREKNYSSCYGPLNGDFTYFSFASIFREKEGFNFEQYLKTWLEFIRVKLNIEVESESRYTENLLSSRVYNQLKKHKDFGELPIKRILSNCEKLNKGDYVLIRTTKRPKRNSLRIVLLNLFKSKKWRRGLVEIYTFQDSNRLDLRRYAEWITLFKFEI